MHVRFPRATLRNNKSNQQNFNAVFCAFWFQLIDQIIHLSMSETASFAIQNQSSTFIMKWRPSPLYESAYQNWRVERNFQTHWRLQCVVMIEYLKLFNQICWFLQKSLTAFCRQYFCAAVVVNFNKLAILLIAEVL